MPISITEPPKPVIAERYAIWAKMPYPIGSKNYKTEVEVAAPVWFFGLVHILTPLAFAFMTSVYNQTVLRGQTSVFMTVAEARHSLGGHRISHDFLCNSITECIDKGLIIRTKHNNSYSYQIATHEYFSPETREKLALMGYL